MKVVVFWHEESQGFIRIKMDNNGLPKLIYHIDSVKAKIYSGFGLILKDLKTVKEVIEILKSTEFNGVSSITKQSLSFYAVITYGKCFAAAEGRGTKLDKKDALKYATIEQSEEHERIIDQRNNYVAHGGLKGYEHNPVVMTLNRAQKGKEAFEIYDNIMELVDIDSQLDLFDGLVNAIIKYVSEKRTALLDRINEEMADINISELYSKAIDPDNFNQITIQAKN